jgi:hypothetical protein
MNDLGWLDDPTCALYDTEETNVKQGLFDCVSVLLFQIEFMIIKFTFNVHRLVFLSLLEPSASQTTPSVRLI